MLRSYVFPFILPKLDKLEAHQLPVHRIGPHHQPGNGHPRQLDTCCQDEFVDQFSHRYLIFLKLVFQRVACCLDGQFYLY